MNVRPPSPLRIFAMVGFALSCIGLLLFLWIAFGGAVPLKAKGYRVTVPFREATQLVTEADVRISGVPVGKVKRIEAEGGRLDAELELDEDYAPLPADARAILRQKTLLGEIYVELTPGTRGTRTVPDGGRLAEARVSDTVELDEILRSFDERTRDAFRSWMQTQAAAVSNRGADINDALGNLEPFARDAHTLVGILDRQEGGVRRLVRNGGAVFDALSERRGQLRALIEGSERVFSTTARRDRELAEAIHVLPTFSRETAATLARLRRFSASANPLVTQLRPSARELSPTLKDLSAVAPDLKALFSDLDPLIVAGRRGLPAARRILRDLRPFLGQADPFLREVIPVTDFIGDYKRELSTFFTNTVASTQATDTPGGGKGRVHYLRTTNPINLENLAVYAKRLGTNRSNPYMHPGAFEALSRGLPVYDDRNCGRGVPLISSAAGQLLGDRVATGLDNLLAPITRPLLGDRSPIAPPCRKQGPFRNRDGSLTRYPQLKRR